MHYDQKLKTPHQLQNNIKQPQQMTTQLTTPIKYITTKQMKRVDSQQAIVPVSYQQGVEARLRENTRIVNMINNNRVERSRSRRKEQLVSDDEEDKKSDKKIILEEIASKLNGALRESKISMESSRRRVHSETKQLEQKLKAFQNSLKQMKQSNIETQQKINDIKNEIHHEKAMMTTHQLNLPRCQAMSYKSLVKERERQRERIKVDRLRIRPEPKYQVKGHYIYPKYLRPEVRYRTSAGCTEGRCRGLCICCRK